MTFSVTQSSWVWYQMKKVELDIAVCSPLQIWAIVLFSCMGKEIVLGNLAKQVFVLFCFYFLIFFFLISKSLSESPYEVDIHYTTHSTKHKERFCSLGLFWNILRRQNPSTSLFSEALHFLWTRITPEDGDWSLWLEPWKSSSFFGNVENLVTWQ